MNPDGSTRKDSFSEWMPTSPVPVQTGWSSNSRTQLAYGNGQLPQVETNLSWQPVAGPGAPTPLRVMTPTMQHLHHRIVRGEA